MAWLVGHEFVEQKRKHLLHLDPSLKGAYEESMPGPSTVLLTWTAFPVLIGAAVTGMIAALGAGVDPLAAFAVIMALTVLCIAILERACPFVPAWNQAQGDVQTDLLHMAISSSPVEHLYRWLVMGTVIAWSDDLVAVSGVRLWPSTWHPAAQLGLALVIAEFGQYWWHRMAHEYEFLWRVHSVHHSPKRLYWLNAARFHPIDTCAQYLLQVTPLLLLGAGRDVLVLFSVFTAVHGLLQHCNVDLHLGPLNWIFSMAELHRWHHSRRLEEANTNYGANLIVWDSVFGTRFLPTDRLPPATIGIADMPRFPGGYLAQLAVPFRWRRTRQETGH